MSDSLIVIPARFGSSRLPGKPLADLGGRPMVVRVLERLRPLEGVSLLVATDDLRIARAVELYGGEAVMTSSRCATGTDRVAEVVGRREEPIVINVQGDEPFVDVQAVARLIDALRTRPSTPMATLACPLTDPDRWRDPNVVKVVVDNEGSALYFSRAPIPWPRDAVGVPPGAEHAGGGVPPGALQHIGVYGYRRDALLTLAGLPRVPLEEIEQLEQLRALHHGVRIRVITCAAGWPGIDTPADLERAQRLLATGADR
jgi:3-deoxy-manno-octulosonate cytidylyltransferase (CMP-KDO synthetase)